MERYSLSNKWNEVSFEQIKQSLRKFSNERNWNQYHSPRNLTLALIGEVGELAECFQWRTLKECEDQLQGFSPEEIVHVGEELSDVLLYLCRLADRCNFHLPKAVAAKIGLNAKKYPVQLAKGSPAKYHAYSSETGIAWNNQGKAGIAHTCEPETTWGSTTLEELRAMLELFVAEREWGALHTPRNLALALAGEAGELCELFQFRTEEHCAPGLPGWNDEDKVQLSQEISDVLIYLIRLADTCGVDLADAVLLKLWKNAQKYPVNKAKGRWEKYTFYSSEDKERSASPDTNPREILSNFWVTNGCLKFCVCAVIGGVVAIQLLPKFRK